MRRSLGQQVESPSAPPGHARVQIRAGIHIGPMHVEQADVFGGTVNFAARVVGAIKDAEIASPAG